MRHEPINVICVKWGNKYGWEYVLKLKSMVRKHLTLDHEFMCMTDDFNDAPIYMPLIPCEPGLPTWWSKVGLFKPGRFPGLNLYLDLDVVILDNINGMVAENDSATLSAPDDFSYSLVNPKQGLGEHMMRQLGGVGTVNSSVMIWRDDAASDVYTKFDPNKMNEVHGDQNWITQALWPDNLRLMSPGWVCSYKYHIAQGARAAPIVVFHGNPKPPDLPINNPVRQAWTV